MPRPVLRSRSLPGAGEFCSHWRRMLHAALLTNCLVANCLVASCLVASCLVVSSLVSNLAAAEQPARNPFAQRVDWRLRSADEVWQELVQWQETAQLADAQRQEMSAVWERHREHGTPPIEALASVLAVADPQVAQLVETIRLPRQSWALSHFSCLEDEKLPSSFRANLNLLLGRWLANHDYLEEAQERLQPLSVAEVYDPPMLMFYRGVVAYRLLDKATCIEQLQPLIDHQELVPRRYLTVAQLMVADIQPVKPDTLDEVSRIMDRIRLRLGNARAGTRVRQEEEDVIAKLDKMIKDLESQAQAAQSASGAEGQSGNPAGGQSSNPAQQSVQGGVTGPGNVDPKNQGTATNWGNLPPKEREAALQQLGKDVPSHYRDVIEEYFRTLAREGTDNPTSRE